MVPKSRIYLDSFSVGIDEVSKRERADEYEKKVVDILRVTKRFSCFEASGHPKIATLMTRLCKDGGRVETDNSCGYPWTTVISIDGVKLK